MALYDKVLDDKWYENLMVSANKVIDKVFEEYAPVYKYILNFIKKNDLHLSNLNLLLGSEVEYNAPLQIYAVDPMKISDSLFRELCKKFGGNYMLQVELTDKQYTINYITKTFIRISFAQSHEGTSILDFLAPIKINNIKMIPPLLELIDLYKQIYNPENADSWAELIQQANKIKKIADKNIKASEADLKKGGNKCTDCVDKKVKQVITLLMDFLKKYTDYILVDIPKPEVRMSILSKNTIQTDFERINTYLSTYVGDDFTIIFKDKTTFLGKDMRIQRYSLYISIAHSNEFSNSRIGFLDIYNNLSYELIPFRNENGINIAHRWAQIRFYYINIWNAFTAYHLNVIKYDKLQTILTKLRPYIDQSIDWYDPPVEYMGIYINEYQAFKQEMLKSGKNVRIFCDSDTK